MADDGLTLAGLRSRLRQIGIRLTDADPQNSLWVGTTREGEPVFMANPTHMSSEERLELFKAIKERFDPFGSTH